MSPKPVRFHDPRATSADFASSILVRCPRCERMAHFERRPCTPPDARGERYPHTRLVCPSCGLRRIRTGLHRPPETRSRPALPDPLAADQDQTR
ncbi:hypothetical protein ABZT04_26890 [Streptomyces sp. NPDC005492]|uniref:hypothetical protein n=1 Tax=Streptomyces sp. NPDC005492 TaxID=3156883 RepID=UPI00339EB990